MRDSSYALLTQEMHEIWYMNAKDVLIQVSHTVYVALNALDRQNICTVYTCM